MNSSRRVSEIGMRDPIKFYKRLLIEGDKIDLLTGNAAGLETIVDRVFGKGCVVFLPRESFLLSGGKDCTVTHQARGAVVVEGRDPQDIHKRNFTDAGAEFARVAKASKTAASIGWSNCANGSTQRKINSNTRVDR